MSTPSKVCFKCNLSKDIDSFYRHPAMKDGRLSKCKECTKKDVRQNRELKIDYYREFDRGRSSLTHRVAARNEYAKTEQGRNASARAKSAFRERNPKIRSANTAVRNAVLSGKLKKHSCEVCGKTRVHGHHDDYDMPLEVRWLCATHHREWHKLNGHGKNRN